MPFSNLSGDYVGANSVLAGATQLTGAEFTNGEAKNFVIFLPATSFFFFKVKLSMTLITKVFWR